VCETGPSEQIQQYVSFRYALPDVVVTSLLVLGASARLEGLDMWVMRTYARLSPDLQADLQLIFAPIGGPLILSRLVAESPSLDSFSDFIGWLASLDPEVVRTTVLDLLLWWRREDPQEADPPPAIDIGDDATVRSQLRTIWSRRCPQIAVDEERMSGVLRLLRDPSELKARLTYLIVRFWEGHFKTEYPECVRRIERNIEYHHERVYEGNFADFYYHVTSQHLQPVDTDTYPSPEHITFVPSCYPGASVILVPFDSDHRRFALIYNCRVPGQAGDARIAIRDLYGPLRALADETRLEILALLDGTERYGQEIVEKLEVGQSTVSRHLQLLVRSGVILERKRDGMKFYRINRDALSQLSRLLSTYRSAEEERG
jgi:ArsR family transcriptional regulator